MASTSGAKAKRDHARAWCWHCGKGLAVAKDVDDEVLYVEGKDQLGNKVKLHRVCFPAHEEGMRARTASATGVAFSTLDPETGGYVMRSLGEVLDDAEGRG